MMTIAAKREKLHDYIDDDKRIEAIFSMVEDAIGEKYDHWEDEEFVAEMKSRIDDYENGIDKGLSWEQVKFNAGKTYQEKTALMKQAASDPLFLADMKEINDDFGIF